MQTRVLRSLSPLVLLVGCLSATLAAAQPPDPEGGDVWVPPPDNTQQQQQYQQQQQQYPQQQQQQQYQQPQPQPQPRAQPAVTGGTASVTSVERAAANTVDELSNHERVVQRFAIGWQGVTSVPIGALTNQVPTVALGIRYWVNALVGVDLGLGFGYTGGNVTNTGPCVGLGTCPADDAFGLALHGGVPIAIFHETHYTFLVIPELSLGFSTGTERPTADPNSDVGRTGFLFQIGARAGAEIHFGFIGIPSLSLQATVGLYFDYTTASRNPRGADGTGASSFGLGTTLMGEPWDLFLGSLTALYYF